MMTIIFATHNQNKLREVREIAPLITFLGLDDLDIRDEIPEPYDTIHQNAVYKAQYIFETYHQPCLAEDSGLEVAALNGAPGAYSARFAGPQRSDHDNVYKLLKLIASTTDRRAQYVSVFAYHSHSVTHNTRGTLEGTLALEPRGNNGFGYDPIMIPLGYDITCAEMSSDQKNAISHRKKALITMLEFLNQLNC